MKAIAAWMGRKGAAFLYTTLLYFVVLLVRPAVAAEAGMWLTGLLGVFAGSNAAVTIGTKDKPAP
jgi:hypothetical protein